MITNGHTLTLRPAERAAREQLSEAAIALSIASPGDYAEVLDEVAYNIGRLVGHGFLDRSDAADTLTKACTASGFTAEVGPDVVQEAIASAFQAGDCAARADCASAARLAPADTIAKQHGASWANSGVHGYSADSGSDIIFRRAKDIAPENVTWVWPGRIPRGKLSLLGGHPEEGKTLVALNVAATVTTGGLWPDGTRAERNNVFILSAEDDAADTIVPRLMAAGADLSRCYIIDAVREVGPDERGQRVFSLTQDLQRLADLIQTVGGASLMVVDVIDSYMGGTDSHKNSAVRGVLAPLKDVAAHHGLAILGLTHFSKQGEAKAILRFTGSIAFIGQARAGWIATPELDESGEPTGRKLFLKGKNNLAPDIGGLAYRIQGITVNGNISTAKVVWDGAVSVTADEALAPNDDERDAVENAANWLQSFLGECARPSADMIKAATKEGIAQRTLDRARKKLKVVAWQRKLTGHWVIALPEVAKKMREQDGGHEHGQTAISEMDNP
jgi:putative DNA primase/helicase